MTEEERDEALMRPINAAHEKARELREIASVLGRASFQVRDQPDRVKLMELSDLYSARAQEVSDSVRMTPYVPNTFIDRPRKT